MALAVWNCGGGEDGGGAVPIGGGNSNDSSDSGGDANTNGNENSNDTDVVAATPADRALTTAGLLSVPLGDGVATLQYVTYGDPEGGTQPLYVHSGGPDLAAAEALATFISSLDPDALNALLREYDLVALDRVGVGSSPQIDCEWDVDGSSPESTLRAAADAYATECRSSFSQVFEEMDTERYAQDVDRLRAQLGFERFNFFGTGYGAQLALTYAALFPNSRRLLVLEAPPDPRLNFAEAATERVAALGGALDGFFDFCDSDTNCPFGAGAGNTVVAFDRLYGRLASPVTSRTAFERMVVAGVSDARNWPAFASELADLDSGTATPAEPLDPNPGLTDGALYATACADAPIDSIADLRDTEEAIEAGAAVFRRELYASLFPCESWDAVTPAIDWESVLGGLFNVMVVTADGDPIVPKAVSDSLLSGISSVSEVNSSDFSHGFGLRGVNSCVDNAILGFLVEGLSQDTECP